MKTKVILTGLMIVLLSGCNQDAQSQNIKLTKHQPQYTTKPQAAISMNFEYLNAIELNKELEIKLNFKVGRAADTLQVKLLSNSALQMIDSQTDYLFNKLSRGDKQEILIRVVPEQAGRHIINITASIDVNGIVQSRVFSVVFDTDSSNQQKTKSNKPAKGMRFIPSQNVISMPASETTN